MIKKKSKVSAEFNMSSLTDIIFLLLIFFMLTSSMVIPNALNLQLPGKTQSTPKSSSTPTTITINADGAFYINGAQTSIKEVERRVEQLRKSKGENAVIVVAPAAKASNDDLVAVLDIAYRMEVKTSLLSPR